MKASPWSAVLITVITLLAVSWSHPLLAQQFKYADLRDSKAYIMAISVPGGKDTDVAIESFTTMEQFIYRGQKFYRLNQSGRDVKNNNTIVEDSVVSGQGEVFIPIFNMRVARNAEGKELCREETAFYNSGRAAKIFRSYSDMTKQYDGGVDTVLDKFLNDLPVATYARSMYYLGLMAEDFTENWGKDVTALSRGGVLLGMQLRYKGLDEVTVPAGKFICHKIKMTGNVSRRNLVPLFMMDAALPDVTFWVTLDKPHSMIRYHGFLEIPINWSSGWGEIFKGRGHITATKVQTIGIDDVKSKDELLERMKYYQLTGEGAGNMPKPQPEKAPAPAPAPAAEKTPAATTEPTTPAGQ